MKEVFSKIKNKYTMAIALSFLILSGIIISYQVGNTIAVKKEIDAISKNAVARNTATDNSRIDNPLSLNAVAADGINNISSENYNANVVKWIKDLIGYRKIETRTLNVPADFGKIQEAINNANRGDIIKVLGGEYKENIVMKNGVSLEGAGADKTTLDGNNLGNAIAFKNVRDPKTYLSGFTIKNAGKSLSGIVIENSSPWIHDNIITENEFGIYVKGESRPVIQKNVINNSSKGIQVYNFIEENTGDDAAAAKNDGGSNKDNKTVLDMAQGENKSIAVEESKTNPVIIDNLITDNKIGIDLNNAHADIEHNDISYNNHYKTYLGGTYGINISGSSSDISSNSITDNGICELCAGIIADGNSKNVVINYNDIWNNKNDFLCFGECTLEENNISEDPHYVDTMISDYKLKTDSALMGKAKDGLDIGIRW